MKGKKDVAETVDKQRLLATEKAIILDSLESGNPLDTQVRRLGEATLANTVSESKIGRFRPIEKRVCAVADMEIIKAYHSRNQEPPSFLEAGPRKHLYRDPAALKIGIVTAGGIAPGLNTVIHSIVHMHHEIYRTHRPAYGFLGGFRGLVDCRYTELNPRITREWLHKGGTGLAAGRERLDISKMVDSLVELGIDILYVIGGEGSLTAAHLMAEDIERRGREIVIAGVPKTMDNDILWVWHSFGFDTAVEEAGKFIDTIHEEAKSTERICLLSLFGRDAGFVAAHAALASGQVDVVLVPEVEFRLEPLLDHIQKRVQDKHYALIVVAEGARPAGYTEERALQDLVDKGYDLNDRSNPRVAEALRSWRLSTLQRAFEERFAGSRHGVFVQEPRYLVRAIPANSVDQIYCQRLADLAVHNAVAGFTDFMISQWLTEYVLVPLKLVAGGHKKIPPGGIFWTTVITSTGQPSFE